MSEVQILTREELGVLSKPQVALYIEELQLKIHELQMELGSQREQYIAISQANTEAHRKLDRLFKQNNKMVDTIIKLIDRDWHE